MNERIRELAKQASESVAGAGFTMAKYEEQFAELIVRECAKFLDENSGSDQCNNVWCPAPEDMLKHFGVEE